MQEQSDLLGWMLGSVAAVVGTLVSAVAMLFKLNESKNAKAIQLLRERADDCENDRSQLRKDISNLKIEIAALKRT